MIKFVKTYKPMTPQAECMTLLLGFQGRLPAHLFLPCCHVGFLALAPFAECCPFAGAIICHPLARGFVGRVLATSAKEPSIIFTSLAHFVASRSGGQANFSKEQQQGGQSGGWRYVLPFWAQSGQPSEHGMAMWEF